jgi:hypothetical protein
MLLGSGTLVQALSFTPDGRLIVAGLEDTSIVIWEVRPVDKGFGE